MQNFTVKYIMRMFDEGALSSEQLTRMYIERIKSIDPLLNSVSEINPNAIGDAILLDQERNNHHLRSPLHGIPVLLKDNINTTDGTHTTANSFALSDLYAPYEATIVKKLKDAGLVVLGKTNLSEFAYFMSYDNMPSGYGSLNGQVKSPYHENIDPLGSSTGSAVAVAASLAPIAIGTETNGSLMAPAYMNQIVSIKPTFGMVSRYGIIPISETQDTAGPMAKTVMDCAYLLDIIKGTDPNDHYTHDADQKVKPYHLADQLMTKGRSVGILTFKKYPYDEIDKAVLQEAYEKLEKLGLNVSWIEFDATSIKNDQTLLYEFKHGINHYLKSVLGATQIRSLKDIINFNILHEKRCLKYGQSILTAAEATSGMLHDPTYLALRQSILDEAKKYDELLKSHRLDALISTKWLSYAPIFGNPSICVPAKKLTDDKPKSLIFVGQRWADDVLIAIANLYEQATLHRIPPNLS